jgi:hypothetical protein
VLFSETLSPDEIEEHFLQELTFHFEGDPQRPDFHLSVRRTNLELLGKQLKSEHPAFNDGRSDFEIGCMNATVDPSEIKRVLHNKQETYLEIEHPTTAQRMKALYAHFEGGQVKSPKDLLPVSLNGEIVGDTYHRNIGQ